MNQLAATPFSEETTIHQEIFIDVEPNREREREILSEVSRLIEEQTRALQGRLSGHVAAQCEERSNRIRNLLQQVSRDKHSMID